MRRPSMAAALNFKPPLFLNFRCTTAHFLRCFHSFPTSKLPNGEMHGLQTQSSSDIVSYSFLEELKSGKELRFELSGIKGHICESRQHGSRFIQLKLENCSVEEKAAVFKEAVVLGSELMTDVFCNYVIQKLFDYGIPDQKDPANQLESKILQLSLQMYGCRVIQKVTAIPP